ncbi:prostaglandin D2 receptor 2-like isoform X2 [Scleropages formosus]|uniref:Prostaglandin D2 receptor 2 n=1 Tax=Scleropages formosus TaxID=113540 RepID=A0A8C9R6I8_SCLFO|nr:prostaglandin D2 receptor 2-like isoform X2 [Scleropages formosus]
MVRNHQHDMGECNRNNMTLGNDTLVCPLLRSMLTSLSLNQNQNTNLAVVAVHGIFSGMGILENALILWVVGFRVRRTVAAVWVLNLALSDFLATLTLPLFTYYLYSSHSWKLGEPLCVAQSTLFFLNMFVSAFLLAVISLDRCLLVMQPIWSRRQRSVATAWKICGLGWLLAAINTVPYSIFRAVSCKTDGRNLCYHNFARFSTPATLNHDCRLRQETTAMSKLLLAFLIPLSVIAASYISLSRKLQQRQVMRENRMLNGNIQHCSATGRFASPLSPRFSKMVVAVIMVFILTWSPYHAFCLLEVTSEYYPNIRKVVEVGLPIATTFSFLNAVLNPFLYAFSCPHFCVRIRESMGALLEGLLDEGEEAMATGLQFNNILRTSFQVSAKDKRTRIV